MSLTAVSTFAGVGGFDSAMQRCGNGAIDGRGGGIAGTLEARGSQFGTDAGSATAGHVVLVDHARREGRGGKGPLVSEDASLTLATGNGQVLIQPTAFGLISSYVKIVRSGARDAGGGLPPEVWAERDVAPTLNAMDNTGATGSTAPSNGNALVRLYGAGITPPADGAKSSSITPRPPTTFTTSSRMGLSDTELILETSFFSVINAIAGFIPLPMHPDSSLRFHFTTKTGWTSHRINDKGELIEQADSARYKQMGNAVAVPVVEFIMQRLVEQENQ